MTNFVFLICSERSGSNFMVNLLNGHDQISGPPPSHLFRLFANNMDKYGSFSNDIEWRRFVQDVVNGFSAMLGEWNTSISYEEILENVTERTSANVLKYAYEKEAAFDNASHIVVKENHCYSLLPYLMSNIPDAKFLYLVRDPRDVAASYVISPGIPGGVEKAIDVWQKDQQEGFRAYAQLNESGRIFFMTYEDVLQETERKLAELTDWLGLPYSDKFLEFQKTSRTSRNANRIDAWKNLSNGVMRDNTSKYKKVLSQEEIKYVELRCFELMQGFGYEADFVHAVNAEEDRNEVLRLQSGLSTGIFQVPEGEEEIRARRLAYITEILGRPSRCLS